MILENKQIYTILNRLFGNTKIFQKFLLGYLENREKRDANTRAESF